MSSWGAQDSVYSSDLESPHDWALTTWLTPSYFLLPCLQFQPPWLPCTLKKPSFRRFTLTTLSAWKVFSPGSLLLFRFWSRCHFLIGLPQSPGSLLSHHHILPLRVVLITMWHFCCVFLVSSYYDISSSRTMTLSPPFTAVSSAPRTVPCAQ